MDDEKLDLTPADRLDVAHALYRLGAGIDNDSAVMLADAVTADAVIDFGPAARAMGVDFPLLEGRGAIVAALTASVGLLDTIHVVTNVTVEADGDGARLRAIVEAAHFPPGDRSRRCVMKNCYAARLRREDGPWRLGAVEMQYA